MQFLGFNITRQKKEDRALSSEYISLLEQIKHGTYTGGANFGITKSMSFAAVFRAAELRSETIASLPIQIIDIQGENRVIRQASPLRYILNNRPNAKMQGLVFWQTFQLHVDLWGDGFALIQRDQNGNFTGLELKMPWETDVQEIDGELYYKFANTTDKRYYLAEEVIHVPGIGFDGIRGKSRIALHRETVAGGLAATRTNAKFWENGAFFRGVLELPGGLRDKERAEKVQADFAATWGGGNNWGVPVLHSGSQFKPISMPHKDAQYIEGIRFTVEEVARIFNIPLHKMKTPDGANYAGNVEQMQIEWVVDTVRPMAKRIETELENKLLTPNQGTRIKYNLEGLLRGDLKTRSQYYRDLFYIGALNPDEIRAKENMNSREGGDQYFTPVNMYDSEQLELVKQNLQKNE
jgi:HK97 family phage portal protein